MVWSGQIFFLKKKRSLIVVGLGSDFFLKKKLLIAATLGQVWMAFGVYKAATGGMETEGIFF